MYFKNKISIWFNPVVLTPLTLFCCTIAVLQAYFIYLWIFLFMPQTMDMFLIYGFILFVYVQGVPHYI